MKTKVKFCVYSVPSPLWYIRLVDFSYYK